MRKTLLLLLGVLFALPIMARDFTYTYEGQTLTYTVLEDYFTYSQPAECDSVMVFKGNNVSGDLIIPSVVSDGEREYTVVGIGYGAFRECTELKSVSISESIGRIGQSAFASCKLDKVEFASIEQICKMNFFGAPPFPGESANPIGYADHLYVAGKEIKDLIIPASVTEIGSWAFYACRGLTSVVISDSVTEIGVGAFSNCSGLTSVDMGDSVEIICDEAFYRCSGLTSVVIGNSVKTIGGSAFSGCSALAKVFIGNSVQTIGDNAFGDCSSLQEIKISDSVTEICDFAFGSCTGIKSVIIGNAVTSIGSGAFFRCENLSELIIGNSVISIGERAFAGCAITSLNIGDSVTEIGDYAFSGCFGLTLVAIGNSVKTIGNGAFRGCNALAELTIGESVAEIWTMAFQGCSGLTSVVIPNSVRILGSGAFMECGSLASVILPQSLEIIDSVVFGECEAIKEVTYFGHSPLESSEYMFSENVYENAVLYVEQGCKSIFERVSPWKLFVNIVEMVTLVSELRFKQRAYSLAIGETLNLNDEVMIVPDDATHRQLVWESSDEVVASVNDGIVTMLSEGVCEITATTTDGSDFSAVCAINSVASIDSIDSVNKNVCDVYSVDGILIMHNASCEDVDRLSKGIYIIRQGNEMQKIAIK